MCCLNLIVARTRGKLLLCFKLLVFDRLCSVPSLLSRVEATSHVEGRFAPRRWPRFILARPHRISELFLSSLLLKPTDCRAEELQPLRLLRNLQRCLPSLKVSAWPRRHVVILTLVDNICCVLHTSVLEVWLFFTW